MRRVTRSILAGFSVVALCAAFMGACSNQGEGDRCQGQNGNDDCADGLVCSSTSSDGICCPADRSQATTIACQGNSGGQIDSSIPFEASIPADSAVAETGADATVTDTGSDASNDASDANDDGG